MRRQIKINFNLSTTSRTTVKCNASLAISHYLTLKRSCFREGKSSNCVLAEQFLNDCSGFILISSFYPQRWKFFYIFHFPRICTVQKWLSIKANHLFHLYSISFIYAQLDQLKNGLFFIPHVDLVEFLLPIFDVGRY